MKKGKRGRIISQEGGDSPHSFSSKLSPEEFARLEKARDLLLPIKEKYKLTYDDLKELIEEELFFPAEIFNDKLTVLGSVVKYLKEEKNFSLRKISNLLKRDERNVWHIYNISKKKYPKNFIIKKVKIWIPISIFSDRLLSALEAVVLYLKDGCSLSYHSVALLLKRDDRTIWTVYQRARRKYVKKK